ncbi:MAG: hypothetical protein ABSE98_02615, partial [Acidimicrobiales bacterium]
GAWEVENPAMDVHAEEVGLTAADPSDTTTYARSDLAGQGQLFPEALAYPTYADTDKIPAVGRGRSSGRSRSGRWLQVAVVLVALAVLAAGTALGLVKAGIIGNGNGGGSGTSGAPITHHPGTVTPTTPLLTAAGTGAGTANYSIDVPAYQVTVTTTTGRSWVSIGIVGQKPIFAGILAPASSQREILLGPSQVDVGAGGTKVVVTSGKRSVTLTPLSAPFSYQFQFTPKS